MLETINEVCPWVDPPARKKPESKITTEEFVAAITGTPPKADADRFVEAVTGQYNPADLANFIQEISK